MNRQPRQTENQKGRGSIHKKNRKRLMHLTTTALFVGGVASRCIETRNSIGISDRCTQTIHERLVNTAHTTTSQTDSYTQRVTNNAATAPETTNAPPSTEQNHSFGDAETRPPIILRRSGFSYPRIPPASGLSLSGCFWCLWACLAGFGCCLAVGCCFGLVACVLVLACFTGCCARTLCERLEGVRVRAPVVQRLRMRLRTGVLCRSTSVRPRTWN